MSIIILHDVSDRYMPHVMAERIRQLNRQYQVNYIERMSNGSQRYTFNDMVMEYPSFFYN